MSNEISFCVTQYEKYHLIEAHKFYFAEARNRLLPSFASIKDDAAKKEEEFEYPEECDCIDTAYKPDFHLLLSEMRDSTLLSVIAAMFHNFDKRIREWIVYSISVSVDKDKDEDEVCTKLKNKVWTATFKKIVDLLTEIECLDNDESLIDKLLIYSNLVNVYKHGPGPAMDNLKESCPRFLKEDYEEIDSEEDWKLYHGDGLPLLKIDIEKVEDFYEIVLKLWNGIPADFEFVIRISQIENLKPRKVKNCCGLQGE